MNPHASLFPESKQVHHKEGSYFRIIIYHFSPKHLDIYTIPALPGFSERRPPLGRARQKVDEEQFSTKTHDALTFAASLFSPRALYANAARQSMPAPAPLPELAATQTVYLWAGGCCAAENKYAPAISLCASCRLFAPERRGQRHLAPRRRPAFASLLRASKLMIMMLMLMMMIVNYRAQ